MQRELQGYERVLWKQRRKRFFLLRKRRVFREEGVPDQIMKYKKRFCLLYPEETPFCLRPTLTSASLQDARMGEGHWMEKSLNTCHVWLLVGFSLCLFFSCLFNVYIFFLLLPSGHSDTLFGLGKGQHQMSVRMKSSWTEMAKHWRLMSSATSLSSCFFL